MKPKMGGPAEFAGEGEAAVEALPPSGEMLLPTISRSKPTMNSYMLPTL